MSQMHGADSLLYSDRGRLSFFKGLSADRRKFTGPAPASGRVQVTLHSLSDCKKEILVGVRKIDSAHPCASPCGSLCGPKSLQSIL